MPVSNITASEDNKTPLPQRLSGAMAFFVQKQIIILMKETEHSQIMKKERNHRLDAKVNSERKRNCMISISTQRSFIMGIAILWIVWFHTDLSYQIPLLSFLRETGYGGVDLFFLLSGVGAWFSLQKNPDAASYLKRRAMRILPSYYPFIIAWLLMMKITGELYGTEIIGNLTMLGWWAQGRNQFNWYVNAIWLFYLLSPVFVGAIAKACKKERTAVLLMAGGFLASVTFFHTLILTAFSRLPVFILGVFLGSVIMRTMQEMEAEKCVSVQETQDEKTEIKNSGKGVGASWVKKHLFDHNNVIWNILMLAGFAILYLCLTKLSGYMWTYGLWWYPFVMIAPGLALDLGCLAQWLQKSKAGNILRRGINAAGEASFEIFLWHIGLFGYVKPRLEMNGIRWLILAATAILIGIAYRKLIEKAVSLPGKRIGNDLGKI